MPEEITAAEIAGFRGEVDRLVIVDGSSFSGWMLSLVPQEGRYHGNGDRDAWVIWQAYINEFGDGHELQRNDQGVAAIRGAMQAYKAAHPDDPLGILPRNAAEENGFMHDLSSIGGLIRDTWNNFTLGIDDFTAWLGGADLFHAVSGAFMNTVGTAAAAVGAAIEIAGSAVGYAWDAMGSFFDGVYNSFNSLSSWDFGGALSSLAGGFGGMVSSFVSFVDSVWDALWPVVLDMDGDGVELISLETSTVVIDFDGDGVMDRGGWVAPDDALLAFDADGDGIVDGMSEFAFADPANGYETDLEGLARHDSNGDGVLNLGDADFDSFVVWRDLNSDGISQAGEVQSLLDAGVSEIVLALNGAASVLEGNMVLNSSHWVDAAGGAHEVLDVAFRSSLDQSVTQNFDWGQATGGGDGLAVSMNGAIDLSAFLEKFGYLLQTGQAPAGDMILG